MEKIFTSLKFSGLLIMLVTGISSYWSKASHNSYIYPKAALQVEMDWKSMRFGIFSLSLEDSCDNDVTDPTISAPADLNVNSDGGSCNASNLSLGTPTTSDNCEVASVENDAPTVFPVGTTVVTWTAYDSAGNSATASQSVTVTDDQKPVISAGANITKTADSNTCGASVTIPTATATDNCTVGTPTGTRNDGKALSDLYPIGTTTITWNVTDDNGNAATAVTQTVTVTDDQKPVISAGADITTTTDPGKCGAVLTISPATASDNCTVGNPIATRSDGKAMTAAFPVGTTTITWAVSDAHGNAATPVTQTVIITDDEKPVIIAGADKTVTTVPGLCYAGLSGITAKATDNCSVGTPTGTRSDGQPLNATYPAGKTVITWTVTDANGNQAVPVEQNIIVDDKEAPVAPELEDVVWGCAYTFEVPTAIDNCENVVTATYSGSTTFTTSGSITWTFTDAAGNASTATQNITIDPLQISAEKVDVLCNGYATGEISVTASGGKAPYTFDWGNLGVGALKTDLTAGTYYVKAIDANGCETAPLEVIITEPDTFVEIVSVKAKTGCFGQNNASATVESKGGVGTHTYLWDNGQTGQTVNGLTPGSHTVTVTDQNGCSQSRTFTISTPQELKITGFLTTETTSYGSATGTATAQVSGGSPNYTFSWSNGQTGQTANNLAAGTYTVTVTDANGCSTSKEVTIIDSISAHIIPTSICEEEEDVIRTSYFEVEGLTAKGGTPGFTYKWNFGENATPATATGPGPHRVVYSVIGDKRITLEVTDSKGRTYFTQIIQYVGGCFANDCGSNDLAADNYFIGDANGNKITSSNCADAGQKYLYVRFPTESTRYSLNIEYVYSVMNLNTGEVENYKEAGCFYSGIEIPLVAQTIPIDYECGDLITIEGIYLTFSNNKNWTCGQGPAPKCYSTNNDTSVSLPLYAVAFPNQLLCYGGTNGTIDVRASGGTTVYSYKLISAVDGSTVKPSQTSPNFTGLPAGKYKVVVDDGEEIFTTAEVEIKQPQDPLKLTLESTTPITCYGGSDGSATVVASGGTPNSSGSPYIYSWENIGQTTPTATNLSAGTYVVRAIDANGCEVSLEVVIAQPPQVKANAGPDQTTPCGNLQTTLAAVYNPEVAEGETPPVGTWTIINGPAGGVIEDVNDPNSRFTGTTGTYTLRWSIECGATDDVKVSFSSCSTLDFDGIDDHVVVGDKFNVSSTFTLEAWVKQDPAKTSGVKTVISKRDSSTPGAGGFALVVDNNYPKFLWNGGSVVSQYPIGTDRWYHLAVIGGGENPGLYVDGIKVSTGSISQPSTTTFPLIIGADYASATPDVPVNYFHGWIEEVRIWKKALSLEQLHFLMNQRLNIGTSPLQGTALPMAVPGGLESATDLFAYFPMIVTEITNGFTLDKGPNGYDGKMVNIKTVQENTAPLPYYSAQNGTWTADVTWKRPQVWDPPNSKGVDNSTFIDWNIVVTNHNISSQNKDITVLGLLNESGKLSITNPSGPQNEDNTGQLLKVTHYLRLNGFIDLFGRSQLIQIENSLLDPASTGVLERDQQGTASSYNYNYWSSPVLPTLANESYSVGEVMKDGVNYNLQGIPKNLDFGYTYHYADGGFTDPRKVSNYWLHKFHGTANNYFAWEHIGSTGKLMAGEGYSMKGTSGYARISDRQNYTFRGLPNNGVIVRPISTTAGGENYLVGNPYPSAISATTFIKENVNTGDPSSSAFNGSLYFWHHFGGKTHYLQRYIGGYAVFNLAGSIEPATSSDSRIDNSDPTASGNKRPGDYIPVGQGFFINTVIETDTSGAAISKTGGTEVRFTNNQRAYAREGIDKTSGGADKVVFFSQQRKTLGTDSHTASEPKQQKLWLKFKSPEGYHRQILVTADPATSDGFDLGYDAPLIDNYSEDMFWLISGSKFVIQGVPDFASTRVLPLAIKTAVNGEFRILIDDMDNVPDNLPIYLKDNLLNEYHDLRSGDYIGTAGEAGIDKRFSIVFTAPEETTEEETEGETGSEEGSGNEEGNGEETGTGEEPDSIVTPEEEIGNQITLFYAGAEGNIVITNPGGIPIKGAILFNGIGQEIKRFYNVSSDETVKLPVDLRSSGVYFINLILEEGKISLKFLVP